MTAPAGPVALLGSGEFEPWTRELDLQLLRRATAGDGTVAIVPTASALEGATFDAWARKGLEHYAALGVAARVLDLRGPDDAQRSDLVEALDRTSLIFFSGGNPAFLASTLAGSPVWDAVLARLFDGAAFAGCSAGACLAGAFAPQSVTDFVWEEDWRPGLELLPNVWVLPHFDALDGHRPGLREYFLSNVPETGWVLGIDERTAVVRIDDEWRVVGEGGAFMGRGRTARRFAAGETFRFEDVTAEPGRSGDRELALAIEPLPPGAGPVALFSSEEFSDRTVQIDGELLERCGPRVGVILHADPSNAELLAGQAVAHYRSLGGEARVLGVDDDPGDVNVLFLAGGDPKNLVPALLDSRLWINALHAWRNGLGLAGSSAGAMALCERCLFAEEGDDVPTRWGRGLGPLRSFALAVHASSRPGGWLEQIVANAPVDVVALEDGAGLLLESGRAPVVIGEGQVARYGPGGMATAPTSGDHRPGAVTRLYHRTAVADEILRTGFVDSVENPRRDGAWEGSWFSEAAPLPVEDGPVGDDVLVLEVPREVADGFEWSDPSKPYRQFVLPREVANRYGPPRLLRPDSTLADPTPAAVDRGEDVWGRPG